MKEHPHAKAIIKTLAKAGFVGYYAGGWVRDFLLQHPSDDIDIATNAPPETIQALFPHTVPIGIAFGIILVIIDGHSYEVATFRQDAEYKDGRRPSRIEFATAIEDARRRDFTINGMFYDPLKEEVLDYVGGRADLKEKVIRAIGDPHARIQEDRLRMIRAVRLCCRFGFTIELQTAKAIRAHATELFPAVAIERVCQELEKGRTFGKLRPMLVLLHDFGLLPQIFPSLKNLPLQEIEKRLTPLDLYPANSPLIASLIPLFPEMTLAELLSLCKKLKLSQRESQFVSFLFHARKLNKETQTELFDWAYFYANDLASIALQILAAEIENPQMRRAFLLSHETRIALLQKSIERIKNQDPVVKSNHLMEKGIVPGKTMGLLLKKADQISINKQIYEPESVLKLLEESDAWPTKQDKSV